MDDGSCAASDDHGVLLAIAMVLLRVLALAPLVMAVALEALLMLMAAVAS